MATKRQQQAQATKNKIIEAMQKLIAEKGYDAVTVDDIATECNIGKGTLYHYFKGKDSIFSYFDRERFDDILSLVEERNLDTIEERLQLYCTLWFEQILQDSVNLSVYWYHRALAKQLPDERSGTHFSDDIENITALLEKSVASGELVKETPISLIAADIVFSFNGATFYRCIEDGFDLSEWAQEFIDHVIAIHVRPFKAR